MIYTNNECPDVTAVIAEDEQLRRQAAGEPLRKHEPLRPSVAEVVAMYEKLTIAEQDAFHAHIERHA